MKFAIINGAYGGIGSAIAHHLISKGLSLLILGKDIEKLNLLCNNLEQVKVSVEQNIIPIRFNLSSSQDTTRLCAFIKENAIYTDILVNAAGIVNLGGIHDVSTTDWENSFKINVLGVTNLVTEVTRIMKTHKKDGSIILINGILSRHPEASLVINSSTTAAIANFAKAISKELSSFGIRINIVNPGVTNTSLYTNLKKQISQYTEHSENEVEEAIIGKIPAKRIAEVADIVNAVYFLCSEHSKYITGTFINIDGGSSAAY